MSIQALQHVITPKTPGCLIRPGMVSSRCVVAVLTLASLLGSPASAKRGDGSRIVSSDNRLSYRASTAVDEKGIIRSMYNLESRAYAGTPEHVARAFLAEHSDHFGIEHNESMLRLDRVQSVAGGYHVRFTQVHDGIPVFRGDVVVSAKDANRVSFVINNFRTQVRLPTSSPSFAPHAALEIARRALSMDGPAIGREDNATLMAYQAGDGLWHLAYRVTATRETPPGDWEIFVDAVTGKVLAVEDLFVNHAETYVQGSGYVFLPDPLSRARRMYNSPGFVDNNDSDSDSLMAHRSLVTLDFVRVDNGVFKLEGPYCTVTDIESPPDPPYVAAASPDGFVYTRSQQEFEAVNAYYHVTKAYLHLLDLGFPSATLEQLRVDPHGYQGQDNSHYSPTGNWISFGEGGVDDAEDADVIWHEYGHAIQYNIVPTWGGGESGALGEGFSDYWAASYSRSFAQWSTADYHYHWVFNWDGHNPFWLGRTTNDTRTYPWGGLPIHSAGQIWSTALMGIWNELGREITDRLVLKSHHYLGSGATAPLAAQAIIQADRDLYGGVHIPVLVHWLGTVKHFLSPQDYVPLIAHTPLSNTLNVSGPYEIRATITSNTGLDEQHVKVLWSTNGSPSNTLTLERIGSSNEFASSIPGIAREAVFTYYISARNSTGVTSTEPRQAPTHVFSFQAGLDSLSPAVFHQPIGELQAADWPPLISAVITDNTVVDSAWVEYGINDATLPRRLPLSHSGDGIFEGYLDWAEVDPQDILYYRILARDGSISGNTAAAPESGSFECRVDGVAYANTGDAAPGTHTLGQNYPNPFNPTTTIRFEVAGPPDGQGHSGEVFVSLKIYDLLGRVVATLVDEEKAPGNHGVIWNATGMASGVYFYRLEARSEPSRSPVVLTRMMVLLR